MASEWLSKLNPRPETLIDLRYDKEAMNFRLFGHRLWKQIKQIPHRLAHIPESPHEIAKAFAVGVFISILPGPGMFLALLVAVAFRLSKAAAVLGALVINPWTVAFFYAASYHVGSWFTNLTEPVVWRNLFSRAAWHIELYRVAPTMVIGASVLGLFTALASYVIVRILITGYRNRRLHQPLLTPPPEKP